jgi:hypothetical protein
MYEMFSRYKLKITWRRTDINKRGSYENSEWVAKDPFTRTASPPKANKCCLKRL